MRALTPLAVSDAGPTAIAPAATERTRLDRFELGLLAAFGVVSMWVVAVDVWHAASHGLVWTGTDGFFIVDQMQYLAWIQSAAHHFLISNLFVLRPTPADYFQPAIVISGALAVVGVAPWLALLLWKPVAVIALFSAVRAVVHRSFADRSQRRAAMTLALFFGSFSIVSGSFGIVGDMMPTWLSWGYPFGLLAVALIVFGLVRYDRARLEARVDWIPGLLGAIASSLHPWQGETMILLILGGELLHWRDLRQWAQTAQWRRLALPALTVAITALPLVYYLLLGDLDISWTLARQASRHAFAFSGIAIGAAPLALVAALGYRGRPQSFLELSLRLWVPVALIIYVVSASGLSATPLHAFNGITIPLAVLAVAGVGRLGRPSTPRGRLVAAAVIALGVLPANLYLLATAHQFVDPTPGNANFITHDERAALRYLASNPVTGGVLTQFYLGETVPAATARRTFVGDCLWSEPNCMPRSIAADGLFTGTDSRAAARQFVTQTGARFILESCASEDVNLEPKLGSLIVSVRRFGCATVYELRPPTPAGGPLAELPDNAVVRAPWRQ
ncbi:MAG: hypothetical protein WAL63_12750 [Solirubrobacteraceae bacterium]